MTERIDLTQFDWMEHHTIKHMEYTGDLAIVDVNAVQMIPELIAELKRCYEEIDRLNHAAHTCDDCGGHRESINDCENVCQCS